jgi:hypothetical protein
MNSNSIRNWDLKEVRTSPYTKKNQTQLSCLEESKIELEKSRIHTWEILKREELIPRKLPPELLLEGLTNHLSIVKLIASRILYLKFLISIFWIATISTLCSSKKSLKRILCLGLCKHLQF